MIFVGIEPTTLSTQKLMLYPDELKNRSNLFCDYRISGEGRTRTSKTIIPNIICDETVNLDYPFGRRANTAYFTNLHTSPNFVEDKGIEPFS